jgi:hypothetical protein
MFNAPLWRDYFVMVGGGAAALTGLVFVAMSLHLSDIASNPTHRHRARTILTALTDVFVRCGLVLMGGQTARAVGAEIFVVIIGVEVVVLRSLYEAVRASGRGAPQIGGGMMASFLFIVSGAWLLLVAVESPTRRATS